jgi:DNA-binding CsgD family transcriptional regulator
MMPVPAANALGSADLRRLLALMHHLAEDDHDDDDLPGHLLPDISSLLGSEFAGFAVMNRATGVLSTAVTVRASGGQHLNMPRYGRFFRTHPVFRPESFHTGVPVALSELLGGQSLRNLPIYQEFLVPNRARDLLIHTLTLDPRHSGFLFIDRSQRRFSERDRAVLQLTAESLRQAIGRHRRRRVAEAIRRQVVAAHEAAPLLTSLTRREHEVVERLVSGATNREIAKSLAIAERTVHKHLEQTYRKLGVTNRTSVVAIVAAAAQPPHLGEGEVLPSADGVELT